MKKPVSSCCSFPVEARGNTTKYYVCTSCKMVCDIKPNLIWIVKEILTVVFIPDDGPVWVVHALLVYGGIMWAFSIILTYLWY